MAVNPPFYEMYGMNQIPLGQVAYPSESVQTPGTVTTTVLSNQTITRQSPSERMKEAGFICLRELFGTAMFTYVACLAHRDILSAGLIYAALQASSEISSSGGMHLNPAISLAAAIGGRMRTPILAIPMIIGQFIGSLLGAGFCLGSQTKDQFLRDRYPTEYYEIYKVDEKDSQDLYRYCFGEFLLTCILVTVFLRLFPLRTPSLPVTEEEIRDYQNRKYIQAVFVGLTICVLTGAMHSIQYVGLMNPFRAFGPMVAWVAIKVEDEKKKNLHPYSSYGILESDDLFKGHWVYWVGPIFAGIVVGMGQRIIGYIQSRNVVE